MTCEENITAAAKLIYLSNYIVVFTGAGISTESGIADFRSPGGLWSRYNPNEYAEYSAFLEHPEKFWKMHKELSKTVLEAKPNLAHITLASLERDHDRVKAIITQNIDFMHFRAGSTKVLEIHGSGQTAHCLSCQTKFHYTDIQKLLDEGQKVPRCINCEGLIKPNVVLFGEQLPFEVLKQARDEIIAADLLLIIGSSLTVYPAAMLPSMALGSGTKIIIINVEPTHIDQDADVVIHEKAGVALPKILKRFVHIQNESST
ncbi:MAG: SIR2 family NAD-dependent protein deacylase [Candidatus Hodarchaeales archaeon]